MDLGTILLFASPFILSGLKAGKDLAKISFDIVGFQIHKFKPFQNEMEIKIEYLLSNPTPTAITIDSIAANVYYQNSFLGFVNMNQPITIKAQDQTRLKVSAKWPITKLIKAAADFLKTKKLPNTRIEGNIRVLGKNIPFSETIDLNNAS